MRSAAEAEARQLVDDADSRGQELVIVRHRGRDGVFALHAHGLRAILIEEEATVAAVLSILTARGAHRFESLDDLLAVVKHRVR